MRCSLLLIFLTFTFSCKKNSSGDKTSGSGLASISIAKPSGSSADKYVLKVKNSSGVATYDSTVKNFGEIKLPPEQTVFDLDIFEKSTLVGQTRSGDPKCGSVTTKLNPGSNRVRIPLCKVGSDGRPDGSVIVPSTNETIQTTEIESCYADDPNCTPGGGASGGGASTGGTTGGATLDALVREFNDLKLTISPPISNNDCLSTRPNCVVEFEKSMANYKTALAKGSIGCLDLNVAFQMLNSHANGTVQLFKVSSGSQTAVQSFLSKVTALHQRAKAACGM